MDETSNHDAPTAAVLTVAALLTRARGQAGLGQLWTLIVASAALRERQAPPGALERVERHLHGYLAAYAHSQAAAVPPALSDTLVNLADHRP